MQLVYRSHYYINVDKFFLVQLLLKININNAGFLFCYIETPGVRLTNLLCSPYPLGSNCICISTKINEGTQIFQATASVKSWREAVERGFLMIMSIVQCPSPWLHTQSWLEGRYCYTINISGPVSLFHSPVSSKRKSLALRHLDT